MSLPDVTRGTQPIRPCEKFEGHDHWVWGVIHLPDGQRIMTCSQDGSLGIWNLQTGERIANWRDGGSAVKTIALSADGKRVVSGSYDGLVRLWNIETGMVTSKWTGHTHIVETVCWNRDDKRVLSGSRDGTARVWSVESGKTIVEIETGLIHVWAAIFSPDMTMIATAGHNIDDELIKIWDANTGEKLASIGFGRKGNNVYCLAWTSDGTTLVSGSDDRLIRTWNTFTWEQIAVLTAHTEDVNSIAISPNSRILASTSWDNTARLWNLENGQSIGGSPFQRTTRWLNCVSFSTNGNLLAAGCDDNNAYTWDISTVIQEAGLDSSPNELDDDAPYEQSSISVDNNIIEEGRDNLYGNGFFAPSLSNHSIRRRSWHIFSFHLPRLPTSGSMRLKRRLTRRFFSLKERTKPTPGVNFERDNDVGLPEYSANTAPSSAKANKDKSKKREEPISPVRTPSLNNLCPEQTRKPFFKWSRKLNNDDMELRGRRPPVVNVPFAHRKHFYYTTKQVQIDKKREEEKKKKKKKKKKKQKDKMIAKNTMNHSQNSSPPTQSNAPQQSASSQVPEPQTVFVASSTAPANAPIAAMSTTSLPHTITPRTGCWTRFWLWLFHCCTSAEYPHD